MKAENEDVQDENSTSPTLNNELNNFVSTNYKKSTLLRKIASIKYYFLQHS